MIVEVRLIEQDVLSLYPLFTLFIHSMSILPLLQSTTT